MHVLVGQANKITDRLRKIADNLPFTGTALALIWRDSDGQYWNQSLSQWQVAAAYNSGPVHKGQGVFEYQVIAAAFAGMDGDNIRWVLTDNTAEASVTVISQGGTAKVLDGEALVRTTWTDQLATDLDSLGSAPTAAVIADAVWDELRADHTDAGSFGESIQDVLGSPANIADAVWDELSTGHVAAGSMGLFMRDLRWAAYNRRKVDTPTNTEHLYEDDGNTDHQVWDLKDSGGNPTSTDVFEKVPQ
jgi:hypothetical protein